MAANLPSRKIEGYAYLTTDDQKFYIDISDSERICINNIPTQLSQLLQDNDHLTVTSEQITAWTGAVTALDNKVDKVAGKGLSTNDYTTEEKTKLAGIATGATATQVKGEEETLYRTGNVNLTREGMGFLKDTTAHWNAQIDLVAKAGVYYVYTDYKTITVDGEIVNVPGLKIGDGTSYLIDMPFVMGDDTALNNHINDTTAHITAAERAYWNDKVTAFLSQQDTETLVFTKDNVLQ